MQIETGCEFGDKITNSYLLATIYLSSFVMFKASIRGLTCTPTAHANSLITVYH